MDSKEQLIALSEAPIASFGSKLSPINFLPLTATSIEIFQMNVGKLCNLQCKHCHVEAGPTRTENMVKETFDQCLKIITETPSIKTVDLTGGAPEMNPHLEWFIDEVSKLGKRVIIRSNLTILKIPKYAVFLDVFVRNKVEVVASLPSFEESKTDAQRGDTVFRKSIEILQALNQLGYAQENSELVLNLVHNPVGAYLPGDQQTLEKEYKRQLKEQFNIDFNNLFCITNLPVSRFLEYLIDSENYEDYMTELVNAFNPAAVENVMCRNTLSIGYDGKLYDCDFNQMLDLEIGTSVFEFDEAQLKNRKITINNHCFGCTAGAGSSCQGAIE